MSAPPVLDLLRRENRERYIHCLYLPAESRSAAAAIWLFDSEVSRIPFRAPEPLAAEVRAQWWREILSGTRDCGGHPSALALIEAIERRNLPIESFESCLESRVFGLAPDMEALEERSRKASATLFDLVGLCVGAERSDSWRSACEHGGMALEIASILSATASFRALNRCLVPGEILEASGLNESDWLEAIPDERHVSAVRAMSAIASQRWNLAMRSVGLLDRGSRSCLLPLSSVPAMLRNVERRGVDPFDSVSRLSPLRLHWLALKASLRGGK